MTDKRVKQNKENVENIRLLLLDICDNSELFSGDDKITSAISSQSALSKYENKDRNIVKSSINTLKRTAEKLYPNGFEEIDKLRLLAFNKINKIEDNSSKNKNTKDYYKERCENAEKELEEQREVNLVAVNQLMSEILLLKNLKRTDDIGLIKDLCDNQIKKLQSVALHYSDFAVLKREPLLKIVKDSNNE
jgi:transcriptional regulator with XRE-family HTH domain